MSKSKSEEKREAKKRKRQEKEARREAAREMALARAAAQKRNRMIALGTLVATAVVAGVLFATDYTSAGAATILLGLLVALGIGLGGLGSAIRPRDKVRSGAIDYGNKR